MRAWRQLGMALALAWVAIGVRARTSITVLDAALPAQPGTVLLY